MKKIVSFYTNGKAGSNWYIAKEPNIMFSREKKDAVVFDNKGDLLGSLNMILGLKYPAGDQILIEEAKDE